MFAGEPSKRETLGSSPSETISIAVGISFGWRRSASPGAKTPRGGGPLVFADAEAADRSACSSLGSAVAYLSVAPASGSDAAGVGRLSQAQTPTAMPTTDQTIVRLMPHPLSQHPGTSS